MSQQAHPAALLGVASHEKRRLCWSGPPNKDTGAVMKRSERQVCIRALGKQRAAFVPSASSTISWSIPSTCGLDSCMKESTIDDSKRTAAPCGYRCSPRICRRCPHSRPYAAAAARRQQRRGFRRAVGFRALWIRDVPLNTRIIGTRSAISALGFFSARSRATRSVSHS